MQDLKVVGVESGALLVATDDGDRYRIAVDDVLSSHVRQARAESDEHPKVPPREIQAHIRAGMSATDVAELTGASMDYVGRFEGPILAEREHIVSTALGVPVHASEVDPLAEAETFGAVIRERLASLGTVGERWAAWKDPEAGWMLKLEFTADEIDHDARWSFDQKALALRPINPEAITLSQQGEIRGGLIPRLRAVAPRSTDPDESRFDSGAFTPINQGSDSPTEELEPLTRSNTGPLRPVPQSNNPVSVSAIKRSEEPPRAMHQTADLLEALRKRRGEREAAQLPDDADTPVPHTGGLRAVDVPLGDFDDLGGDTARPVPVHSGPTLLPARAPEASAGSATDEAETDEALGDSGEIDLFADLNIEERPSSRPEASRSDAPTRRDLAAAGHRHGRRGNRASMPSWDEIVFGARTDDDPA